MSPRRLHPTLVPALLAALCAAASLCAPAASAQTVRYTVTDLGPFGPRGVNDAGQVAGSAIINGRGFAVLYDGTMKTINPPGSAGAEAWAINHRGQIAGSTLACDTVNDECHNGRTRAFVYHRGAFTLLGTLGGSSSFGIDIDERGRAVGYSYTPGPTADAQAFASDGGPLENLGAKMGVGGSIAGAVNAVGQITGRFGDRNGSGGFLYDTRDGTFSLFPLSGFPRDLNDHGQIVGGLSGNDDGSGRAFLYAGGAVKNLGTLLPSHTFSSAWAVNNAGQIVGVSSVSWFTRQDERAFLYEGDRMLDLNAL
ncbi:MAG: hypothetical protein LC800_07045, partial [Acidobacteria bacterium]|nr:hypothetical protein [Acidobacteriota bacterium]